MKNNHECSFECWDCEEREVWRLRQFRSPYFPQEMHDRNGEPVKAYVVCLGCWQEWPDNVRHPLNTESMI